VGEELAGEGDGTSPRPCRSRVTGNGFPCSELSQPLPPGCSATSSLFSISPGVDPPYLYSPWDAVSQKPRPPRIRMGAAVCGEVTPRNPFMQGFIKPGSRLLV